MQQMDSSNDQLIIVEDCDENLDMSAELNDSKRQLREKKRLLDRQTSQSPASPPAKKSPSVDVRRRKLRYKHTEAHKCAVLCYLAEQLGKGRLDWKGNDMWKRAEKEHVTELSWGGMRALAIKLVPKLNTLAEDFLPPDVKEMLNERVHLRDIPKSCFRSPRPSEVYRRQVLRREVKRVCKEIQEMDGIECSSLSSSSISPLRTRGSRAATLTSAASDVIDRERLRQETDTFSSIPFNTPAFDATVYDAVFEQKLMPPGQLPMFFKSLDALLKFSAEQGVSMEELTRAAEQLGSVEAVQRTIVGEKS